MGAGVLPKLHPSDLGRQRPSPSGQERQAGFDPKGHRESVTILWPRSDPAPNLAKKRLRHDFCSDWV